MFQSRTRQILLIFELLRFSRAPFASRRVGSNGTEFIMCHVLIIEDEPLIALDLEDLLRANGALSFSFAEGQQAAIALARLTRPDLIMSDVSLVDGSGPLAVEAIHGEMGAIPVIFVTATPEAISPCASSAQIFRKPLDRRAIGRAFRELAFEA